MAEQRFSTAALRYLWAGYRCQRGSWSSPTFYGDPIGGCPAPAVDAYRALERALMSEGYKAEAVWSYVCRNIASSGLPSLHGYGIAIDIDWNENPQTRGGDPFSGKLKENHVDAVMGIKLTNGKRLWWWGGYWTGLTMVDRMHFQLDCSPSEALTIDWSTVPDSSEPKPPPLPPEEDEMVLKEGASGNAVKSAQRALNNWSEWNEKGWQVSVDGTWEKGSKMTDRVKEFQKALNLPQSGEIDGVTAAYLVGRYDPPKQT
jgi:hypothetical protein